MSFSSQRSSVTKTIGLQKVAITSGFWSERIKIVAEDSLPAIYEQMKETGRWDCLKLRWKPGDPHKPRVLSSFIFGRLTGVRTSLFANFRHQFCRSPHRDSDVAKWLEAACYVLTLHPNSTLSRLVEEAVDNIRGAQHEDGYINTYYTVVEPDKRWTNIAWSHELYCAGHLLEAALAHYTYSGSYRLLGPLMKFMKYINSVFGLEKGHEEIELALVRAYDITGDDTLLTLAHYFISERGTHRPEGHYYDIEASARGEPPRPGPGHGPPYSYHQADRQIQHMRSIEGHSVRAMYWLAGAAGVARLTNDPVIREAIDRLWESTTHRKMYATGGLGAMPDWEGFGPDYYLPNESGYLETCAAIALIFFAHQMIQLNPLNMEYAQVLELALYNAALVGVSLDGKSFFYDNPLATTDGLAPDHFNRKLYYTVHNDDTIFVNLYISSTSKVSLSSGTSITIKQRSCGPCIGGATFAIEGSNDLEHISFCFRIPVGSDGFAISSTADLQGHEVGNDAYFLSIKLKLKTPIIVTVTFTFKPRKIYPHPLNLDNRRTVAIARGPFIYCAETIDNTNLGDLRATRLPDDATFTEEEMGKVKLVQMGFDPSCMPENGSKVVFLKTQVRMVGGTSENGEDMKDLILIPYFMWANRGRSNLRVWLPRA
ncbi:hypothetical protein EW145_g4069 [Phellinidium pouzarii]|uniref:Uncharacterized protein n=1 Tax=Phellinidium pouzarii TaxID=167371 RepID=A0A4S4L6P4_9AGAM|nr:hypothetical protein EW145_g4069 [Phellinidium pouzarii]